MGIKKLFALVVCSCLLLACQNRPKSEVNNIHENNDSPICTGVSPTWTSTPDYASVSTCVSNAASGDTIIILPGTATWSSALAITKGIKLQGAGIGNTVITGGGIKYQPTNPGLNEPFRLTGFTLDGNNAASVVYVVNSSTSAILTNIRIDNNRIINGNSSGGGVYFLGMIYGLIDNNQLDNNATTFRLLGQNNYSWIDPLSIGSANYIYIENNTISNPGTNGVLLSGWGARWVFRYNTVDLTGTGDPVLDAHGNLSGGSPPACDWGNANGVRSVVGTEIYENTFTNFNRSNGKLYDHRGGTGIVFNNTSSGSIAGCNTAIVVREEDDDAIGSCYPLKTTYPGYDSVKGTYIWSNIHNGGVTCFVNYDSSTFIISQQDFWADVISWNGGTTTYFTKGLSSARGNACSDGDIYWETDLKKLYRCVGSNNWMFIYTPYIYPHPKSNG